MNNCADFIQTIFGADCLLCGAYSGPENLCSDCLEHLPYLPEKRCRICSNPSNGPVCGICLSRPPRYSRTLAVLSYEFPVDALMQSLKYQGNIALAATFANLLVEASKRIERPDFIVPVPLHPARLKERGFNQAMEIGRIVSKKTGIELAECRKTRDTPSQTALPLKEREKNVRNAFACDLEFDSSHVAILDDVMTTGSTVNELARMLLERSAGDVSVWTVARAIKSV